MSISNFNGLKPLEDKIGKSTDAAGTDTLFALGKRIDAVNWSKYTVLSDSFGIAWGETEVPTSAKATTYSNGYKLLDITGSGYLNLAALSYYSLWGSDTGDASGEMNVTLEIDGKEINSPKLYSGSSGGYTTPFGITLLENVWVDPTNKTHFLKGFDPARISLSYDHTQFSSTSKSNSPYMFPYNSPLFFNNNVTVYLWNTVSNDSNIGTHHRVDGVILGGVL